MPKLATPEGEGKRVPVMTRTTPEMRRYLEEAAAASGRSLGQEVEFRLNRDKSWEATKEEIGRLHAEAAAAREAARIQALREAGFRIVREASGGVTVNVSADLLHAEADGIMKSGFIAPAQPEVKPAMIDQALVAAIRIEVQLALREEISNLRAAQAEAHEAPHGKPSRVSSKAHASDE